jgi:adenylate cyclase
MPQSSPNQIGTAWYERLKQMRTGSGLFLFFYVLVHFSTHGLGLVSHEVLGAAGEITEEFWGFLPISILLYGALAVHFVSALVGMALRRDLQLSLREWIQTALGLSIPFLMLVHVMGTRYASARYGLEPSYTYVLVSTFISSPIYIVLNAAGLVAAWVHGCIGLYMWSRFKDWYRPWFEPVGLVLATLIPATALAGFLAAGRRVELLAQDPGFMENYRAELNVADPQTWTSLLADIDSTRWGLIVAVLSVVVLQILRRAARRKSKEITITYLDGPKVVVKKGGTVLEASRAADIPHASVCGGRGRCSTCRVQIIESAVPATPPLEAESRVLERIRAPEDVRLACQLRPEGDIKVQRLLPSDVTVKTARTVSPGRMDGRKPSR